MPRSSECTERSGEGDPPVVVGVARPRVALIVDRDNFACGCNGKGITVSPATLKERAKAIGTPVWSAVFADSSKLTLQERCSWYSNGFDIHDCPRLPNGKGDGKDSVDPAIIEKLHALASFLTVDVVVLASADRDYLRAVQAIRDGGKQVRILVPTAADARALSTCADGVIVYKDAVTGGGPSAAAAAFVAGKHRGNLPPEAQAVIDRLRAFVRHMDRKWELNKNKYGFMRLVQMFLETDEARDAALTVEDVRRLLQILHGQGVVTQHRSGAVSHYRLDRTHAFVSYVRRGGESADTEIQAPENASRTTTAAVHEPLSAGPDVHPRVQRFNERLRKRDQMALTAFRNGKI